MSFQKLLVAAGVIALAVHGAKNWTEGAAAPAAARGGGPGAAPAAADLDIRLELGFKGRGQWIEEGEDRKIYLVGSVRNRGTSPVRRLRLAAMVQDEGSLGGPDRHVIELGPYAPGESVEYEDLLTDLLPKGQDAMGNEVFEFSYELEVLEIE